MKARIWWCNTEADRKDDNVLSWSVTSLVNVSGNLQNPENNHIPSQINIFYYGGFFISPIDFNIIVHLHLGC
jgi:hypothetical protein